MCERPQNRLCRLTERNGEARRDQRIRGLKCTRERQVDRMTLPFEKDFKGLTFSVHGVLDEFQRFAASANGYEAKVPFARGGNEFVRMGRIGIDDGDPVITHDLLEETELDLEVGRKALVIVEMIARDVREGGSGNVRAGGPLVETNGF